jgi:TolB-like protein
MSLLGELQRRNVIRMAGLYLVGAWLVLQVAATLLPVFEAPAWVMKVVVALLAIGLIAALVFAWVFELTPEGLKRDAEVPLEQSIAPQTARRMDRLILVGLATVIAMMAIERVWFAQRATPDQAPVSTPATPEKSIAVMAFNDLSPNADQGYFSDGMAEAVLNALSQVRELRVAGRSSSFHFKGRNVDAREIGRTLGVAHILEGSVRKQDSRVRINAQLVRASDGIQLWSKTFDGDLTDVFELQDQIARAITGQLQVVLEGGADARLVPVATTHPDAYELYLKATSIFDRRDYQRFPEGIAALKHAIDLDPKFARAWSRMAAMEAVSTSFNKVHVDAAHQTVLAAANAALALDPNLAEPWAAIANMHGKLRDGLIDSREAYERALAVDPDDVTANFWAGLGLAMSGYVREGAARMEHGLKIDPHLPNLVRWRGILYMNAGDAERARQYLERARSDGLRFAGRELADLAFARGDSAAALRLWPDGARVLLEKLPAGSVDLLGAGLYGNDPSARQRAVQLLETHLAAHPGQADGTMPLMFAKLGQPARALQIWRVQGIGDPSDISVRLWSRAGEPIRALPDFHAFLRERGFYALWDKYGPPDLCQRVAMGDYRCD